MGKVTGTSQVIANLNAYAAKMHAAAPIVALMIANKIAEWAKAEHSFTNRTGNLEQSIQAAALESTAKMGGARVSANMLYAIFVELARDGAYEFLWTAVIDHEEEIKQIALDGLSAHMGSPAIVRNPEVMEQYEAAKQAVYEYRESQR